MFNPNFTDINIFPSNFDNTLAYGRFQVSGIMWVNFTLKKNSEGDLWVSLPFKKSADPNAKKKYKNEVNMVIDEESGLNASEELKEFIVAKYNEMNSANPATTTKSKESNALSTPEKETTTIPF